MVVSIKQGYFVAWQFVIACLFLLVGFLSPNFSSNAKVFNKSFGRVDKEIKRSRRLISKFFSSLRQLSMKINL